METFLKHITFKSLGILEINNSDMLEQIWKRRGPQNDEDPSNGAQKSRNCGNVKFWSLQQ